MAKKNLNVSENILTNEVEIFGHEANHRNHRVVREHNYVFICCVLAFVKYEATHHRRGQTLEKQWISKWTFPWDELWPKTIWKRIEKTGINFPSDFVLSSHSSYSVRVESACRQLHHLPCNTHHRHWPPAACMFMYVGIGCMNNPTSACRWPTNRSTHLIWMEFI